jgi:hypothetical protein
MTEQAEKYADTVGEAIAAHRRFARDAIEQAADRAADRIKRGIYSDRAASDLMIHFENARTALDVLGQRLDGLTSVSLEAGLQAWYYVGPLMEAMYHIGGSMEVSEAAAVAVVKHGKREAGAARGNQRKAEADEWRGPALEYARKMRKEHPSISQNAIVEKIREMDNIIPPQAAQVKDTVAKWERDGELTRRQKKSRIS